MNQDQIQIRKHQSPWQFIILVIGIAIGWFANNQFGGRYELHSTGALRINTHSGKTWFLRDGQWKATLEESDVGTTAKTNEQPDDAYGQFLRQQAKSKNP